MEANSGSSVRVFDGTTDFRVWRARVENELMRYHLLGYVKVRGYNGSQSFTFNGEEVPPRCPVIHLDDAQKQIEQQQQSLKEEQPSCGSSSSAAQPGLGRWDVLGECAEAKSILQRCLHPDVESAILNKNVYDSWTMLCALYDNRSTPGAHDVYEMHRVLHHMRLGDKKGESAQEFVTRWEMMVQQYAIATGIELTDGFRSAMLAHTLPSAWRPTVASWRGFRPFVPYPELVQKVVAEQKRLLIQAEAERSKSQTTKVMDKPKDRMAHTSVGSSKEKTAEKTAEKPTKNATEKPADKTTDRMADKPAPKQPERESTNKPTEKSPAEVRSAEKSSSAGAKTAPGSIDVTPATVNSTSGEASSSSKATSSTRPSDTSKMSRSPTVQEVGEKSYRDRYSKRDSYSKYDSPRHYERSQQGKYSLDKYGKSPREDDYNRDRYKKSHGSYDHYSHDSRKGPVSCFYCLKVGHHLRQCWYLKADIENGLTHAPNKKYSCVVTIDRNSFMVQAIEKYINEENRARGKYVPQRSSPRERSYDRDRDQQFAPPIDPPHFAFHESEPTSTSYNKRSRSVFQSSEHRDRDSRLQRSRSLYRGADDVGDSFSPRKRSRAPSYERQLSYGS